MAFEDPLMPSSLAYSFYPAAVRAVSPIHVSVQNGLQRSSSPHPVRSTTTTMAQLSRRMSTSTYSTRLAHLLLQLVRTPRSLAHLLAHLDWVDVLPLLCTCKALHDNLFASTPHLDVLLSRFVPGYAYSLGQRDLALYQDVPITLHDLDLLLLSLKTPLSHYPSHGLHILNALYPTYEDDAATLKLIRLTQAHTRFVLLLQSIVHSSPLPIPPDLPAATDDFANLNNSPVSPRIPSRELVFPAPLAFPTAITTPASSQPPKPTSTRISRNYKNDQRRNDSLSSFTFPGPKRRLSLANNPVRPPPPPEEPRAMKMYSATWRRRSSYVHSGVSTTYERSFSPDHSRQSSRDNFNSAHRIRSSDSISSLYAPSPPFAFPSRNSFHTPSPPSPIDYSLPTPQNVHALRSALCRTRAPILRVFVPTHSLTSAALEACERQLQDSGTWEHMSVGDVVCNFGYVPNPEPDPEPGPATTTGVNRGHIGGRQPRGEFGEAEGYSESSSGSDDDILMRRRNQERRRWSSNSVLPASLYPSPMYPHQQQTSSWLLFDGEILIPYIPPDLLHIPNPLSLPSPFYYNHFLAHHLNLNPNPNPRFVLDRLPVFSPATPPILPQQHPVVVGNGNGYTSRHGTENGVAHTVAPTPRHPPPLPPKPSSKVPPPVPPKQIATNRSNPYVDHHHVPTQQSQQSRRHSMSPLPPFSQPPFSNSYSLPSPSVLMPMQSTPTSQMATPITLTQTTSKVPSPQSPTGYVSVKKFVWTGAVRVPASQEPQLSALVLPPPLIGPPGLASQNQIEKVIGNNNSKIATRGPGIGPGIAQGTTGTGTATATTSNPNLMSTPVPAEHPNTEQALGSAWHGTWIFEVEGTKEGREVLLSLLAGKMPALPPPPPVLGDSVACNGNPGGVGKMLIARGGHGRVGLLCEVVRDRSGGGVVWIRVLPM